MSSVIPVSPPPRLEDYGLSIQFQRHDPLLTTRQTLSISIAVVNTTVYIIEMRGVCFAFRQNKRGGLLAGPGLSASSLQDRILKCPRTSVLKDVV